MGRFHNTGSVNAHHKLLNRVSGPITPHRLCKLTIRFREIGPSVGMRVVDDHGGGIGVEAAVKVQGILGSEYVGGLRAAINHCGVDTQGLGVDAGTDGVGLVVGCRTDEPAAGLVWDRISWLRYRRPGGSR